MKRILLAGFILFMLGITAKAQGPGPQSVYSIAAGFRYYPGAITVKGFIQDNQALEGIAYFWSDGTRFTGLYEIHGDFPSVEGLKWYYGPGAHVGFWKSGWKENNPDKNSGVSIGVDGVLGLDYKIYGAPIDLAVDWQPSFSFIGYNYFEAGWGGISVRFAF